MHAISLYAHKHSANFEAKVQASIALLQRAGTAYTPIAQASSLGAEDMVVSDLLHRSGIDATIFVLETGQLHAETVALIERLSQHYQRPIDIYKPAPEAAHNFVNTHGDQAMYASIALRQTCCHIRKMEPLSRALLGKKAWITGLRREQSSHRAELAAIEEQTVEENGQSIQRAKINPLADWTWPDVWHYIALQQLPYNPLHDQFFPSIGCAPCTRAISVGEDFRAGRWWWETEAAKECGLHVSPSTP